MTQETMWVVGALIWLFTLGSAMLYFLGILAGIRKTSVDAYLHCMFKGFEFCLPTNAAKVPAGPEWFTKSNMTAFASALSVMAIAAA
jgi:hypothetical protein